MLAFGLVLAIFCFWSFVGFAIISALFTRRNLLQSALLAPVAGLGATVLLVTALNWVAPVRIAGPIATVLMLALSAWLLRRRRTPVPFRRLAPFVAVVLLAALAVGYPMFRFGFNWVSYCNEDMANYCLSTKFLLNHNQFMPPLAQDILAHRDASLLYWYFDVLTPIRHGTDEALAWVLSLTGLASHQAFMPMILAFQLVLITATGALVLQSKKYRSAALLVCFWLAVSALITLGSVYQLFGQVSGLAALAGAATVLLRPPAAQSKSELVLGGFLLASLSMIYPEVLPFLVIGYGLYHAISIVKGYERVREIAGTIWPIAGCWLLFVNVSLPVPLLTLLRQSQAVMPTTGASGLFPFYMTPAAFAYLWGFRAISEAPQGIFLDIGIVAGALIFGIAVFGAAWHAWKRMPAAIVCLIMMALSVILFRNRSEFGLYKIAMYLQPFLLGVMVLTWYEVRDRVSGSKIARVLLVAGLALAIGFGARGQLFYTIRSMGLAGGGLTEIPNASGGGLISELKSMPPSDGITMSDTSNLVLAKFEAAYRGQLYFVSQDFFDGFLAVPGDRAAWLNPIYGLDRAGALKVLKAAEKSKASEIFDMHGALPTADRFTVRLPISGNREFPILEDSTAISVLNRRSAGNGRASPVRLTSTQAEPNRLAFVVSDFGRSYYGTGGADRSLISMYQVEGDFFFRGGTMASLGRVALFRVLHPSTPVHLVVEYTASLNHDGKNLIPAASAIGGTREMFPAVGRGSARLISGALQPQRIAGGEYVALDMGAWGRAFPDQRSFIMGLWGREYLADSRRIVGFCRDISLISDDQYHAIQAPSAVRSFPGDLENKSLEYSGIYEDGWVAESSYMVLQQNDGANHLVVSLLVPTLKGRRPAAWAALLVDGREVARKHVDSGSVIGFNALIPGEGRRRIGLRFDNAVGLPSPDTRPVSALIRYAGFQH
ncbi:MAG TPA: hypothetical protein VHZ07_22210 [Bryobacteraceae bacterium]|nr:hypothetical protein [Bryobacteraceae bacterium]